MPRPEFVTLTEVGPRDGLQNEPTAVPPAVKVALVRRLLEAGFPSVEAGAFVSPRRVPQMADSGAVLAAFRADELARCPVLVPNLRGYHDARAAGAREVAVFAAASETFSMRNTQCTIAEGLKRIAEVCEAARADGVSVRGYLSCVVGCPYEGEIDPDAVASLSAALHDLGCREVSLGDTIGVGTAGSVARMLEAVARRVPVERLAGHFHDTYGQALANILVSLDLGLASFDCSVAGLGGCPYAAGATGNVASEDVVYLLNGLGIRTGVALDRVVEAGEFVCAALGRRVDSRAGRALAAQRIRREQDGA
jgi:hydroxymethylglutaryl-CoA lyase